MDKSNKNGESDFYDLNNDINEQEIAELKKHVTEVCNKKPRPRKYAKLPHNKNELRQTLKNNSPAKNIDYLLRVLDDELEQPFYKMDSDFVDALVDLIKEEQEREKGFCEKSQHTAKAKSMAKKTGVILTMVVIMLSITIPTIASHMKINVPSGIVTVDGDHYSIDLRGEGIAEVLENDGFENFVLPEALLDEAAKVYNYNSSDNADICDMYEFDFDWKNIKGHCYIQKFTDKLPNSAKQTKATANFENVTEIQKDNYSVLVFGNDEISYIYYITGSSIYDISLDCGYKSAYKIAETI